MRFLTIEQIIALHSIVAPHAASQVRSMDRLEAAVAAQTQVVFGHELYPDAITKAAALIKIIIAGHPFADGNKRAGILIGLVFLKINSLTLIFQEGEIEDFAVQVAADRADIAAIAAWLRDHTGDTINA